MSTYTESPTLTDEPPPQDSRAAELVARRRKRLPALTLALALLVAAAVAFIGGVEVQKHWGATSASTAGGGFAAARAAAAGGASGFAGRGGFGGATGGGGTGVSGTVTLIKGSTLYVTSASGNTVLVHTTAASAVTKTVAGTVTSIRPGSTVTVVGAAASDGSYTASQVTVGGSNG